MSTLFFDIETRSRVDLELAGAWAYAADTSTEALCVGYAVDDGDPLIWIPRDPIPEAFITAAADPTWSIVAHHFMFERAITTRILTPRYGWPEIPLERQICSMTLALASAMPGALDNATAALGLPWQKDREGYRLMRKMSRPLPRRKSDPPDLIRWHDNPEARARLAEYCKHDVVMERAVFRALPPLSPSEQTLFILDAIINQRGFCVDTALAQAARDIAHHERIAINAEIATLTEGEITTADQRGRILAFVHRHGHVLPSLTKQSVATFLAHEPGDTVRRLLELRREGARASVRKLDALLASVDSDSRLRGTLRFHAAGTGRWSGRGYQPQNLKKVETTDTDAAVDAILAGDIDRIRELGAPLTVAGDISRSIICAAPGHVLIGGDFSAIESRVLAWLAGEDWKLENYRQFDATGDPALEPYCVTASKMLGRMVTPDDEAGRQIGKVGDLALGYGGSIGAWRRFNANDERPDGEILQNIADWRRAHPAIGKFWKDIRRAALQAVHTGQQIELGRLSFVTENGTLRMVLPSGRAVSYPQARLGPGKFEGTREVYFKDNARGAWTEVNSWYGLLTENVVQAIARDLLAAAIVRLEAANFSVTLHIHDEVVCEVPEQFSSVEDFLRLLTELPEWATGLPIAAKAWTGKRYAKTKTSPPPSAAPKTMNGLKVHAVAAPSTIELEPEEDVEEDDGADVVPLADLIGEPPVNGKIVCPFHDDHTPSLVIFPDHFHCFVCGAHGDAVDWLMMVEGMTRKQATQHLATWDGPRVAPAQDNKEKNRDRALQLWNEAGPIAGTLAARYLSGVRGIDLAALPATIDEVLRFHRHCPFDGAYHPCLIALMRDASNDEPTGIHRIGLTPEGHKLDRQMLGPMGVVKIWPAGSQLVVGEGIETVLAAATRIPYRDAPLQPAWAVLSASALERLPVLPGVERLIILVDHDPAGTNAARTLANRWQRTNRTVIRLTPKRAGADFNDLVLPESVA
jgi:Toprim domain/CHC2 zinc finger